MRYWIITDVGLVRQENQDSCVVQPLSDGTLLAVVCDGMGGASGGELASRLASSAFSETVKAGWKRGLSREKQGELLQSGAAAANRSILEEAEAHPQYQGMGTTLVGALIGERKALFLNVGDSRAYHISEEGIEQITVDHSLVQLLLQNGEITPEEASNHPDKNIITRAVGTEKTVTADLYDVDRVENDMFLLCSDGLTGLVTDQEILFEVLHGSDREDCCQRLLEIVKSRGAPDNVTVALIGA